MSIPVVAIGGITCSISIQFLKQGVDAVAVASAIAKGDIEGNARKFMETINNLH